MKPRIPKIAAFAAAAMIAISIMTPATIAIAAEPTVEAILTKSANGISNDTIKLERTKALIEIGESADINIVYGPTDVVWTSDDVSIVSVTQGGVITGISAGCATVTATVPSGATATCTVTVVSSEDVDKYIHPTIFNDVATDAWYYVPVMWACENHITSGTTAKTFAPNAVCTRSQMVQFLWNTYGENQTVPETTPFKDVKNNAWYANAVRWAYINNITAGTSPTTFSPNASCTRAQAVTFIWNALGRPEPKGDPITFTDIEPSDWYFTAVRWAADYEITAGTGGKKFSPNKNCSRAEIVTLLYHVSIMNETHRPEGGYD